MFIAKQVVDGSPLLKAMIRNSHIRVNEFSGKLTKAHCFGCGKLKRLRYFHAKNIETDTEACMNFLKNLGAQRCKRCSEVKAA